MGEYQPDPKPDGLVSARNASKQLGIGRNVFKRHVDAGIFRGVRDPISGRTRYHIPTLRLQFAAYANGPAPVEPEVES